MAAPTPEFLSGRRGCVFINGLDLSEFFNSFEFGQTKGTIEANTFRSRSKRFVDDLPDSSVAGETFWDPQKRAAARELDKTVQGTALSNIIWLPGGDGFGKVGYAGLVITTENPVAGATDAVISTSFAGQPTGTGRELIEVLFPLSDLLLAASPFTGTTLGLVTDPDTVLGGAGYLQVMEMDGTGSVDVEIHESDDGFAVTDNTIITFANIAAAAGVITSTPHERIELADDATVLRQTRVEVTLTTVTRARLIVGFNRRQAIFV